MLDERSWTDRPGSRAARLLVRVPETVTVLPGRATAGLTEVIARDTGALRRAAAVAGCAAPPDRARPASASAEAAMAVAAQPVSSGRGMAEMVCAAGRVR